MATDQQAVTVIKNELSWMQAHERLIIVFLVLLVGAVLGNKWLNNSAADAKTKYGIALQESEKAQQEALQARSAFQVTLDTLSRANVQLAQAAVQRSVVLEAKQQQIQSLPLPEVANEWQKLIGGTQDLLASTAGINITDAGARKTVSQLESVPVLQADKKDLQAVNGNLKIEVDKAQVALSALDVQIKTADHACELKVDSVKADARKSKRTWFIIGFVAGLGTRIIAKF